MTETLARKINPHKTQKTSLNAVEFEVPKTREKSLPD